MPTRVGLLETDSDHADERLDAMQRIMIGVLVSLALVAVTGALNVVYAVATR
jgi:hypothetical protein